MEEKATRKQQRRRVAAVEDSRMCIVYANFKFGLPFSHSQKNISSFFDWCRFQIYVPSIDLKKGSLSCGRRRLTTTAADNGDDSGGGKHADNMQQAVHFCVSIFHGLPPIPISLLPKMLWTLFISAVLYYLRHLVRPFRLPSIFACHAFDNIIDGIDDIGRRKYEHKVIMIRYAVCRMRYAICKHQDRTLLYIFGIRHVFTRLWMLAGFGLYIFHVNFEWSATACVDSNVTSECKKYTKIVLFCVRWLKAQFAMLAALSSDCMEASITSLFTFFSIAYEMPLAFVDVVHVMRKCHAREASNARLTWDGE